MNITSIGGQELFRILAGYEFFQPPSQKSTTEPTIITTSVESVLNSGSSGYLATGVAQRRYGSNISRDELAKEFADMGRRLDAAFAEGKITEEEFNDLNKSLKEYIINETERWDSARASRQYTMEAASARRAALLNGELSSTPNTSLRFDEEEYRKNQAAIKDAINSILNRSGFRTNIQKMFDLIEKYRKDLSIDINLNSVGLDEIDYDKINIPFNAEA